MKYIALIPARYAATRFPAKLMKILGDKPVIRHTYDATVATGLFDEVIVVTDSDIIYNEIFQMYDVAYPAMALVHPFTAEQWNNATMSGLTLQRCDPSIWNNILYMSRSREISASQLELLKAWNQYLNKP